MIDFIVKITSEARHEAPNIIAVAIVVWVIHVVFSWL